MEYVRYAWRVYVCVVCVPVCGVGSLCAYVGCVWCSVVYV